MAPDAATPHSSTAAPDAATPHPSTAAPTALLLFLPAASDDAAAAELSSVPSLSTAILSATQGAYTTGQLLLDLTQGARVSSSAYDTARPPALSLQPRGTGAIVAGWQAALARAHRAPQVLHPGSLASRIPGGAGYAGIAGEDDIDGVAAADQSGHVAALSLGSAATLGARIAALHERERFVVADLPAGADGRSELRALSAARPANELEIVVQRGREAPGDELLWIAVAGLGGGGTLSSQTTNERGLIATVDLAPTILRHLGLTPVPDAMRGKPIARDGAFDGAYLRSLKTRLTILYDRRLPAFAWLLGAWLLLLLATRLPGRAARLRRPNRGPATPAQAHPRAPPAQDAPDGHRHHAPAATRAQAWAARVGALAFLWTPVAVLVPAALEPSRNVEDALLVLLCFALGALTDRLLPWPRAPLAPAVVAVLALTADALAGTQLLMRSLLGPNPALGVRFYGIGNELKSGLAVLVLAAVAAALYPAVRGRRAAVTIALCGIVLAIVEGSARIGAGVGGVILVSAGTAVATVMLLADPGRSAGRLTRRRALVVIVSPIVGLIALAAIDLTTAHGLGHYTGSVLDAHSFRELRDIVVRRYKAAYEELAHGGMPFVTAFALIAAALGVRHRRRLLAPVGGDPAWLAALAGGLTAGVVGALSEDSGPVLLVVAVFTLACVLAYLWNRPADDLTPRTSGTPRAARSRARTPPAGRAR